MLDRLRDAAEQHGLTFGPDPATIGHAPAEIKCTPRIRSRSKALIEFDVENIKAVFS